MFRSASNAGALAIIIAALVSPAMRSHWTAAGWEPAK